MGFHSVISRQAAMAPLYLAIVGTGLVGAKLISQIASLPSGAARFRVVYIASSKRSILARDGIDLSTWKASLSSSTTKPDLGAWIHGVS